MLIVKENFFINKGEFSQSDDFIQILGEIRNAVRAITWHEEFRFVINPTIKANGVVPIKTRFVESLVSNGWVAEKRMFFADGMNPGPVDAVKETSYGDFAVEWETGNISSSHRALNKISVGIIQKAIIGGILILPVRSFARYLTDRIGNYEEIEPYFPLYHNLNIQSGFIGVISVNYDDISSESGIIPKGKDGNAEK